MLVSGRSARPTDMADKNVRPTEEGEFGTMSGLCKE
jgi:hypothetical protein